jgi:tetratricopeptide (TPR) repeat protein
VKTAPLYEPAELFSVSTRSQDYNEDSRAGVFYAQSWGLVHYLLLGRPGHEVDWTRFLKILADGTPSGEALELAFGVDERGLNQELLQYAESEDWPSRHIPIEGALAVSLPEPTPLDAPDALYYLGDLMHHMDRDGNVAEATPWFEAALRLDPAHQKSANALLSMGEYRPPAGDDLPPIDPDRAIEAINGLIAAGNLDSALALARDLRNRTADPELREQLDENIGELEKTAGENRVIREYNRAVEMVNTGDYDAATRVLEAILPSARDPEIKAAIQKLLRDMESAGPR